MTNAPAVPVTPDRTADIDNIIAMLLRHRSPAHYRLAAVLDPLDDTLMETLQAYLAHDGNRRTTAKAIHVHTNTIDYRLGRIGALTSIDHTANSGRWRLRAALIARGARVVRPTIVGPVDAPCTRHQCTDCIICGLGLH